MQLTIKQASIWASEYLKKDVTPSNISYLIQYGRIGRVQEAKMVLVNQKELEQYYESYQPQREQAWKSALGGDINWHLSFEKVKEAETTKHVHRLHPYKGKFIPQLVEYFLGDHTDAFKPEPFFSRGDIVCDPFCGSGTTLVQANELGLHAIGVDISAFNALIGNTKVLPCNLRVLKQEVEQITQQLRKFVADSPIPAFEQEVMAALQRFNQEYFPVPDYKYRVRRKEINEDRYGAAKAAEFLPIYQSLVEKHGINTQLQRSERFLDTWYLPHIRAEMSVIFDAIKQCEDKEIKKVLSVILSRTMRSCRATTHADLATLIKPVTTSYYCAKHGKMCKPLFSMLEWWNRYSKDTIQRLAQFDRLRTDTLQCCLTGDSRALDIQAALRKTYLPLAEKLAQQKCAGIFSSPPYLGLIDYHEQHAYAYELFGFARQDELEIGPLYKGKGKEAKTSYIEGIAQVLLNSRSILRDDFNVFLVANDKYGLYPEIAKRAGMVIVNEFRRPVLNRTEKDKTAYAESIFHLRERK